MVMKTTCELHSSSHSPSTSSSSPLAVLWFEVINLSIACQWQWSTNKFKLTEWSTLLWEKYYCKEIAHTSLTSPPFEMTDNSFCLASVSFCSTNVVPCTIALELIVLSCASANIRPWLMGHGRHFKHTNELVLPCSLVICEYFLSGTSKLYPTSLLLRLQEV